MIRISNSEPASVCIIGIDPGTESLGVAIIEFNPCNLDIISIEANTYFASRLHNFNNDTIDRVTKLNKHYNNLLSIFKHKEPILVISESPFINMRMPAAYGALTEVVCMIRQAVIDYSPSTSFFTVEPSNVKKAAGAAGNADKLQVKNCLLNNNNITNYININNLDEHSIDAICVAYHHFLKYRNSK